MLQWIFNSRAILWSRVVAFFLDGLGPIPQTGCVHILCAMLGDVLVTWFYGHPDTDSVIEWHAPQKKLYLRKKAEITCNIEEACLTTSCMQAQ